MAFNGIASLVQLIPAMLGNFKGRDNKAQNQVSGRMAQLADAQTNMDNPMFQSLYKANREGAQQDLASTIAELSRQNRKLVTMGRTPLLDQERGGESIFRNLMASQASAGDTARENTFAQLRNAESAYSPVYNAYGNDADQALNNKKMRVSGFQNLSDALRTMGIGGEKEDMNDLNQKGDISQQFFKMLMGL